MIYVCDRVGNRLQVFTPEGKFVKEEFYEKNTKNAGSVWDVAFSRDPQQRYIFIADGVNEKVKIIDRADDGRAHHLRRRRPSARSVLRRAQHRDRLARATCTRPRPTRENGSSASSCAAQAPVTAMNQGAAATWPQSK